MIWNGKLFALLGLLLTLGGCIEKPNLIVPKVKRYNIIPKPQFLQPNNSLFIINPKTVIQASDQLSAEKDQLKSFIDDLFRDSSKTLEKNAIVLTLSSKDTFGLEGYALQINSRRIAITGFTSTAISRGIQSLKQLALLNPLGADYLLPGSFIKDSARFSHRGLLLDCSRHFFSKEVVKKYIDLLALYKMNTLHWHLTEDQGWRLAIDKYPKLTEVAAYRTEIDGSKYGGFYTKDDIEEIVAYADAQHINIIAEIELPGHSQAAIAAYPQLSCTGEPIEVANDWGVFKDIYCAGNDSVFTFLEDVLTEVMELFPSKYIHIGGDEAPKVRWEKCDKCQKRMLDHQLKDEHELQSYFIQRIERFLNENGRQLIGWDEILEGGLADGAIVQSWRGMQGGIDAVKQGHQAIMSPTSHAYFDYDLKAIDLKKVYSFNPIPEGLTPKEAALIIGGECNMWTEHVPDENTLDSKVFPRLLAMSEVLWSDIEKDYEAFYFGLQWHYPILDKYKVKYGEEALPMSYELELKGEQTRVELIPYSANIQLKYNYECESCDTTIQPYLHPLNIEQSSKLNIQAYKNNKLYGKPTVLAFAKHKAINKSVHYNSTYNNWYTAGGDLGLVDGKLGSLDFRDGGWQGFWGEDAECTIDFKEQQDSLQSVSVNFYQYNNSWIFIPKEMKISTSLDGKVWEEWAKVKSESDPKQRGKFIKNLSIKNEEVMPYRFLKVEVKNLAKVPDWHEAAGSDAWIFMDEIVVQ